MTTDQWNRLSEWHGAWLAGDARERRRLRDQLAATAPDLVAHADDLTGAGTSPEGFLETPAFVLTARQLAFDAATLAPGTSVGPYRVRELIARGGMGIVYRATDTRLERDVALKMLAPVGGADDSHIERFLDEARLTASVDHPNVMKIFDVGVHDGQPFMVIELFEGETVRSRLDRGPLAEEDARRIAAETARGLAAAAGAGLVHRDLKPENLFLTRAGVTKILDFGIAKLAPDVSRRTRPGSTLTGILLGTAGYLAPEQIRGDDTDSRADLFALGSILYEMLTGQRAFACENTVDTLHAILHAPAPNLLEARNDVSASLAAIVMRLLEKDPNDRFQSAADLAWALDRMPRVAATRTQGRTPVSAAPSSRLRLVWIGVPVLALAIFAAWWAGLHSGGGVRTAITDVAQFSWTLPAGTGLLSAPAVSPDSRRIAWAGIPDDGPPRLYVRDLASGTASPIPGTEGARHPFWSPDSRSIGFFARGKLKKVLLGSGPPVELTAVGDAKGGAWSPTGVIVFQPAYRDAPLMRISDRGGKAEPATVLAGDQDETSHRWPAFLPDGVHFVYLNVSLRDDRRGIYVGSLDRPAAPAGRLLFTSDTGAVYAQIAGTPRGVLVSAGGSGLEARPFDPATLQLVGDAQTLGIHATGPSPHYAQLGASSGAIAFGSSEIPWGSHLASVGRDGRDLRLRPERDLGGFPRMSNDGRRLARTRVDPIRGNPDIWVDDLVRGTQLRLTTSSQHDVVPVWSPDDREVAFRSGTVDETTIGFAAADGAGLTRTLPCPVIPCEASDWSPDGKSLLINVRAADIWIVPMTGGGPPRPLLAEPSVERDGRISGDGRWLAYVSDESGTPEVSIRSLSGPPRRYVISRGGGDQPVWRRDGTELFFAGPDGRLVSVPIRSAGSELTFGTAVKLNVPPMGERHWGALYDVSPDGQRVYFLHAIKERPPREFGVVMGWSGLLKSR